MLQLSGLARSTFYYYLKHLNTDKYECEKQEIQEIYNANKGRYGYRKVEMFYGEKFESVNAFIDELKKYIHYYNNERISLKLKGMSPVQYRTHSLTN